METPLQQRWNRFAEEDLDLYVGCTTAFAGFQVASEYRSAVPVAGRSRFAVALRKAAPKFPSAAFSAAVGLAGMKIALAGVTYFRQDFSRANVVLAFPVFGAMMNLHRGPRAIAKGVVGFAALGLGVDYAASRFHQRNFEAQRRLQLDQWRREAAHTETFVPHAFEVLGTSPRED